MAVTVRLPVTLRQDGADTLTVTEPVGTIAELVDLLDRRLPGFRAQWDDSMLNFAANDELILHRAGERRLTDDDVVEIVPAISGGAGRAPAYGVPESWSGSAT